MKTFEEEYKELAEWYFSEQEKLEGNTPAWDGALDGAHTDAVRNLTNKYRARLSALRNKYKK